MAAAGLHLALPSFPSTSDPCFTPAHYSYTVYVGASSRDIRLTGSLIA